MDWTQIVDHLITALFGTLSTVAVAAIPVYFGWRYTMAKLNATQQTAGAALQASNENAVDIATNTATTEETNRMVNGERSKMLATIDQGLSALAARKLELTAALKTTQEGLDKIAHLEKIVRDLENSARIAAATSQAAASAAAASSAAASSAAVNRT